MPIVKRFLPDDVLFEAKGDSPLPETTWGMAFVAENIWAQKAFSLQVKEPLTLFSLSFDKPSEAWKSLETRSDKLFKNDEGFHLPGIWRAIVQAEKNTQRLRREALHALLLSGVSIPGVDGVWQDKAYVNAFWWRAVSCDMSPLYDDQGRLVTALRQSLSCHYAKEKGLLPEDRFRRVEEAIERGAFDEEVAPLSPCVARSLLQRTYSSARKQPNGHFFRRMALFARVARSLDCDGVVLCGRSFLPRGSYFLFPDVFRRKRQALLNRPS